jgi:signal transduction histidine kinase/DNA-binding response OmpR family regulator
MKASEQVKILAVAQAPDTVSTVKDVLAGPGQQVVVAGSGREALRKLLRDDFAAIIIDTNLPKMSGRDVAARIRKRRRCVHTPIIFLTSDEETRSGELLDGCDYMCMPIDPEVMRSRIGSFVDLFQKTATIRQQAAHRVQLAREQAARQAAEKAMRRSALLSEASRLLSRSLDFDATLTNLHRAVVPALADACQPVLYDPSGDLWFAPVNLESTDGQPQPQGSSSRIQTVAPALTVTVREAIESGHVQTVSREIVRNAPNLGGRKEWSSVIVAPLVARDNPLGAMVCCRQSARRKFQPTEIALMEDLAARAATALDNAQLYQTIRDGERRKDEFLAMLGHELRNPLAAITNAGELTRLLNPKDPTYQETLEIIRQQASLMKRLVDDLLDVSRITSGRVQLKKSIVSAGEVMARVAEANGPLFTSRGHTLHLSVPSKEIRLEADPFRLEQILSNLMVNAAKYTDPGGKIWFDVSQQGAEVRFRVKDTGMGIGPDLLPSVFDLFSQANRSLHRSEGGLGIGLTIVKGLAELHGGRVFAHSDGIGRGAEFIVALPAMSGASVAAPGAPTPEVKTAERARRVLVVEDQPALLRVTVALLKMMGHDVRAAADGPEALLAVREYQPEIVFLDIGLPGMDGYEVAQRLRAELGEAAPTLVAMTGYGQHEVNRHAQKAKFDHHLVKPADIAMMRALLS